MPRVNKKTTSSGKKKTATKAKPRAVGFVTEGLGFFEPKTIKVDFEPKMVGKYLVMAVRNMNNGKKIIRFLKGKTVTSNPAEATMFVTRKEANDFMDSNSIKSDFVKVAQIMNIGHYANIEY